MSSSKKTVYLVQHILLPTQDVVAPKKVSTSFAEMIEE